MTAAQETISTLSNWINESSKQRPAPLHGEIAKGPWAVLVPLALDAVPSPEFEPEAFPIWINPAIAPATLPPIDTATPEGQGRMFDRLAHLLFLILDGKLPQQIAIIGLETPETTLQEAINAAGMGSIDLQTVALLFVPLWALSTDEKAIIETKMNTLLSQLI